MQKIHTVDIIKFSQGNQWWHHKMLFVFTGWRNGSCRDVKEELSDCFLQCIVTFCRSYSLWFNNFKGNVKGAVSQKLIYCNSNSTNCHQIEWIMKITEPSKYLKKGINNTACTKKKSHGWTNYLKKIKPDCNCRFWKLFSLTVFQSSFWCL